MEDTTAPLETEASPVKVNVYLDSDTIVARVDEQLASDAEVRRLTDAAAKARAAAPSEVRTLDLAGDIEIRSESRREIAMRVVPWGVAAETPQGPEVWQRGALSHIDPARVVLRMDHVDPAAGRGLSIDDADDGAHMVFRVAQTQRGDEILELARMGVTRGVSVGYLDVPGGVDIERRDGRRTRVVRRAELVEVSTTWRPTWEQAAVLAVRSQQPQGEPVAEPTTAPAPQPDIAAQVSAGLTTALDGFLARSAEQTAAAQQAGADALERLTTRFEALEERSRRDSIIVPGPSTPKVARLSDWASVIMRSLAGVRVSPQEIHERALDDIIVTENPGLVPAAYINDIIGKVDEGRPFLNSTRRIDPPATGMSIDVPVLANRPTAAVQATEKTEIESTALTTTIRSFPGVTIAGGADVSIQMLRRADPSFSSLLFSELQEAYARVADSRALATLFNSPTSPGDADIDPNDLQIGDAWENSMTAYGRPPDTVWLSSAAVKAFINAKDDGTNKPLYFTLNTAFTVGGGPGGTLSALRPVYVPGLDGTDVDVMIGPSGAFVWAEDGAITLQADNPTLAGRDIALVGILFLIPRYPAAFTTYDLGS